MKQERSRKDWKGKGRTKEDKKGKKWKGKDKK